MREKFVYTGFAARLAALAALALLVLGLFGDSLITVQQAEAATHPVAYRGNIKTMKFHHSGCEYYNCKNCVAVFSTRQEAISAGYDPCKVCRP